MAVPLGAACVVVKIQVKLAAIALPAASFAAVVMVAVYCVLPASAEVGANVAVLPLTFTVPVTAAPPEVVASRTLVVVSVEFVIASEKVADSEELSARPVAPLAGTEEDPVPGAASGAAAGGEWQGEVAARPLPPAAFCG